MPKRTSEIAVSDRLLRWLAWLTGIGIVYGMLLPFEYRAMPFDQAVDQFVHLDWTDIGLGGRYGYLALFAPFGFLTSGALSRRAQVPGVIITVVLGAGLGLGVEFLQTWVSPRTVAASDVWAEFIGWLIGIAIWLYAGEYICALVEKAGRGNHEALRAGLLVYLGVYVFIELFPFDFLSLGALVHRLISDQPVVWISSHYGSGLRGVADILNKLISTLPIGVLAYTYSRQLNVAIGLGLALGFGLELLQFFEASGEADILSLLLRCVGCVMGFAAFSVVNLALPTPPAWVRAASWIGLAVYVLVLNFVLNLPLDTPLEDHAAILNQVNWLPLYNYYFVDLDKAIASIVNNIKVYIPFGAMVWLISGARDKGAAWSVWAALITQAGLEAAGFWFHWRRPDVTDVLLAALGSGLGFIACAWLRRSLIGVPVCHVQTPARLSASATGATMDDTAISPSSASILLASVTLFILYASFYPFDFTASAYTPERFRRLTDLAVNHSGRGDIAGNILLFLPFGFLGAVALSNAIASVAKCMLKLLAAALALAVVTQTFQLFLPTRDASAEDIVNNMVGAALGGVLGLFWASRSAG